MQTILNYLCAFILTIFLTVTPGFAATADAFLVQDVNTVSKPVLTGQMAYLGKDLILAMDSGLGMEPHIIRHGSTIARPLKDIYPGLTGSLPIGFTRVGQLIYFTADHPEYGRELWRTDGTSNGTVLVKDLRPGQDSSTPGRLIVLGDTVLFTAYFSADPNNKTRYLCYSNGNAHTTQCIASYQNQELLPAGTIAAVDADTAIITASTAHTGAEPYLFSRVTRQIKLIADLVPGPTGSAPQYYVPIPGSSTVVASIYQPTAGHEPYLLNIHSGALTLLADINPGVASSKPKNFKRLDNGHIVFTASAGGDQLWRTALTPSSTLMLRQLNIDSINRPASGNLGSFVASGNRAFFVADDGLNGLQLWSSDGSISGTTIIGQRNRNNKSPVPYPFDLHAQAGRVFYKDINTQGQVGLYYSNGTTTGTGLLQTLWERGQQRLNQDFIASDNSLAFIVANQNNTVINKINASTLANEQTIKIEPVSTDDFSPEILGVGGLNKVILKGQTDPYGFEPYVLNPQNDTITLLKDIFPGATGSNPKIVGEINNKLLFSANNHKHGQELWITDGTKKGTQLLKDINPGAQSSNPSRGVLLGNSIIFSATTSSHGGELWISDGTAHGTMLLKDINTGSVSSNPLLNPNGIIGNNFVFSAETVEHGRELWITDGTTQGTKLLADINLGTLPSTPQEFYQFENELIFCASSKETGREFYRTNGTSAGTRLIRDFAPGPANGCNKILGDINRDLIVEAYAAATGMALYKISAPTYSFYLVKSISPVSASSKISRLGKIAEKLVLKIDEPKYGAEPWVTDGTQQGTTLLADINPGAIASNPASGKVVENLLVFSAHAAGVGRELFATDGTSHGTTLLSDIFKGVSSSTPVPLYQYNGTLYLQADNGKTGRELFKIDINQCNNDPNKLFPGDCGCGRPDLDLNQNGISDCLVAAELTFGINQVIQKIKSIRVKNFNTAVHSSELKKALKELKQSQRAFNRLARKNRQLFGVPARKVNQSLKTLRLAVRHLSLTHNILSKKKASRTARRIRNWLNRAAS